MIATTNNRLVRTRPAASYCTLRVSLLQRPHPTKRAKLSRHDLAEKVGHIVIRDGSSCYGTFLGSASERAKGQE